MNALLIRIDNLNEPHTPQGLDRCRCDSPDCTQRATRRLVWRDPAVRWTSSALHCSRHAYEIATAAHAGSLLSGLMAREGSRG